VRNLRRWRILARKGRKRSNGHLAGFLGRALALPLDAAVKAEVQAIGADASGRPLARGRGGLMQPNLAVEVSSIRCRGVPNHALSHGWVLIAAEN